MLQGADAYQANPCLWLWGPLHFDDLVAAGGFTSGSCWAWSCLCLSPDPTQPPAPIPRLLAHAQGLGKGGVAMVSLCRCGGEKGSATFSGKWGHGGFAGTATAVVVAFSNLPSGPVARSPDDI